MDISLRPENPAESVRSFGGDLDLLGRMVAAYVRGYHDNGMLTSAKHFPGRGDIEQMPGNTPFAWNNKPAEAVVAQDFLAFKHAIDACVDFVMSEHVAVPAVAGGSELPASVERRLATGWLRDSLEFAGILTTDDLWHDHVVARFGAEEVAVRAFEAGHDIILKPRDPVAAIDALVAAVRSGRISERRVDDAVRRLLNLKARLNLHNDRFVDATRLGEFVGTPEHWAIAQEVADWSLTLLKNDGVLPLTANRIARAVNINVQKNEGDLSPRALDAKLRATYPGIRTLTLRPDMDPAVYEVAWAGSSGVRSRHPLAVRSAGQVRGCDALQGERSSVPAKSHRGQARGRRCDGLRESSSYPHLIREIPEVSAFLVGYGERGWFGNQEIYFDSFIKVLTGALVPAGRLPVTVSERCPLGSGLGY